MLGNVTRFLGKGMLVLAVLFLTTQMVLGFSGWYPPTAPPPDNNSDAPLNVSEVNQVKLGALQVGGLSVPGSSALGLERKISTVPCPNYGMLVDDILTGGTTCRWPSLYVASSGNVGVNTYDPKVSLDVNGNSKFTGNVTLIGQNSPTYEYEYFADIPLTDHPVEPTYEPEIAHWPIVEINAYGNRARLYPCDSSLGGMECDLSDKPAQTQNKVGGIFLGQVYDLYIYNTGPANYCGIPPSGKVEPICRFYLAARVYVLKVSLGSGPLVGGNIDANRGNFSETLSAGGLVVNGSGRFNSVRALGNVTIKENLFVSKRSIFRDDLVVGGKINVNGARTTVPLSVRSSLTSGNAGINIESPNIGRTLNNPAKFALGMENDGDAWIKVSKNDNTSGTLTISKGSLTVNETTTLSALCLGVGGQCKSTWPAINMNISGNTIPLWNDATASLENSIITEYQYVGNKKGIGIGATAGNTGLTVDGGVGVDGGLTTDGLTVNGISSLQGDVGISAVPGSGGKLTVGGDAKVTGKLFAGNFCDQSGSPCKTITQLSAPPASVPSQWQESGNNILNTNSGNVGIGTSNPGSYKLNVNGDMFASNITANNIVKAASADITGNVTAAKYCEDNNQQRCLAPGKIFGNFSNKSLQGKATSSEFDAAEDGFVLVQPSRKDSFGSQWCGVVVYVYASGSRAGIANIRAASYGNWTAPVTCSPVLAPIKNGERWRVANIYPNVDSKIIWIPLWTP